MELPAKIEEYLEDSEALLMDPRERYDGCIVGIGWRTDGPLAVYSIPLVLDVLERRGMDREAAEINFSENILGAWVGEGTPIFVELIERPDPPKRGRLNGILRRLFNGKLDKVPGLRHKMG